ncbi:glycosyltransferase [Exiguobacterium sp. AM39-5BH]|nr:glycosyltransferase [Exiguobacterium sp. AM39-5BH]
MVNKINVSKPYTVVEGIAPILKELAFKKTEIYDGDFDNTILYTGGINENYGVIKLILEFMKIKDQKLRLFICGAGPDEDKVKKLSKLDARIFYFGLLSREEVLYFQSKCTLLINPRSSNEEYTKYSFPSKLLEYMSSGRPVAAYMLDGIPKEYRNHILELNSELDLNVQIREIMKMDITKLNEIGNLAKEFVENNKNKNIQSLRILKLIRENNGENFNG